MLAGDFPLELVERRELFRIILRLLLRSRVELRGLLSNGENALPDHELRSSGEENGWVGDVMHNGESMPSRVLPGGVGTSSCTGDAVESEVREVGCSMSALAVDSSPGLMPDWARVVPVGIPRWSEDRLVSHPHGSAG